MTDQEQTIFNKATQMLYCKGEFCYIPKMQQKFIFYVDFLSKFDYEQYDQFVLIEDFISYDYENSTNFVIEQKTFNIRTLVSKLKQKLSDIYENIRIMKTPQ